MKWLLLGWLLLLQTLATTCSPLPQQDLSTMEELGLDVASLHQQNLNTITKLGLDVAPLHQQDLNTITKLGLDVASLHPQALKSIMEVELDMAPTSFDDQYKGCTKMMEKELEELNHTEFTTNSLYSKEWTLATQQWLSQHGAGVPRVLSPQQEVALLVYTRHSDLYRTFNRNVSQAGSSLRVYLESFHFKVLHFLLTQALATLKATQRSTPPCLQVYRGVEGIRFTTQPGRSIRFGHFTSTSLSMEKALTFGQDTFFYLETCYGVLISDYSIYPDEKEVLIPPFESFEVVNVTQHGDQALIRLRSQAGLSNYNCEFVKEKRCKSQPCALSSGRSSLGVPPHLWVLLLAAVVLAAPWEGP
ncbi:LOW QUALITY PROTEIN: erythroblast NAD(P)(+)--arginine ADP-ribosyltransferase-like [Melanerpes formicivorus]|uniref:LOW QUALITY PROTEIN: erythroblast NAD(P)(+)--arginine ADP-ribosyltransferase-like n=1 Tax=Melanerpes formicivorus TaxID=211600 RepID=UPI00358E9113